MIEANNGGTSKDGAGKMADGHGLSGGGEFEDPCRLARQVNEFGG
jgi:hypothetical protein